MTLIGTMAIFISGLCLAAAIYALEDEQRTEQFKAVAQLRAQDITE